MNSQIRVNRWNAQQIVNGMMREEYLLRFPDIDAIDWNRLSKYAVIPYPLLDKYRDKWNWSFVCRKTPLTTEFIWMHIEDVDWVILSNILKEEQLEDFDEFVVWSVVARRSQSLSKDFQYKYINKLQAYVDYNTGEVRS